jgi:hypothetical protein
MPTKKAHFDQIRSWLNEVNRNKQAAVNSKSAKAYTEPGGYMGETTHPSKDVDDHCEAAREGSRSAENEKDIKEMEPAGNVNETSETSKKQEDLNYNIGVRQSATGEDPSTEDNYRSNVKDPGTSHPANAEKIGPKYGSYVSKEASELASLADEIMADYITTTGVKKAAQQPVKQTQQTKTAAPASKPAQNNVAAVTAGYELAAQLGLNKTSADNVSQQVISNTIKNAQMGADRVGAYLVSLVKESEALHKQAAGEVDPAMLAGAAGGGDPAAAGGMPPEAAAAGAMPADPAAGGGGEPAGDDAIQELAMALMELGIEPEQLAAAVQGGGAGGDPAGAGAPPMEGSPAEMGGKIASAVKNYKRTGKFQVQSAKTAAERAYRNEMKKYILEIIGAARS